MTRRSRLVAIEPKVAALEPENLCELNSELEALEREVRKPREMPAIGGAMCASRDSETVEYALRRTLSPALMAHYQTQLPDKQVLVARPYEFHALHTTKTGIKTASPMIQKVLRRTAREGNHKG